MNILRRSLAAILPSFLGGESISCIGAVTGVPAMGTTGDLQKGSGEIRVHLVRARKDARLVAVEMPQCHAAGDSAEMYCVRLDPVEAARLAALLAEAAAAGGLADSAS